MCKVEIFNGYTSQLLSALERLAEITAKTKMTVMSIGFIISMQLTIVSFESTLTSN